MAIDYTQCFQSVVLWLELAVFIFNRKNLKMFISSKIVKVNEKICNFYETVVFDTVTLLSYTCQKNNIFVCIANLKALQIIHWLVEWSKVKLTKVWSCGS